MTVCEMKPLYELVIHNLTKEQAEIILSGVGNKDKYLPEMKEQLLRVRP